MVLPAAESSISAGTGRAAVLGDRLRRLLTAAAASVWLHQGLWCKVAGRDPNHEAIVARVPGVGEARARAAAVVIGSAEVALAGWLVSGRAPAHAAAAQTALLVGMNAGGLALAPQRIPRARRMLARNAVLLAVIWAIPLLRAAR